MEQLSPSPTTWTSLGSALDDESRLQLCAADAPAGIVLGFEDEHVPPGGIGRGSSPAAEAVSDALRRGAGSFLDQRRRTAAFTLTSMAALGAVAAYQFG